MIPKRPSNAAGDRCLTDPAPWYRLHIFTCIAAWVVGASLLQANIESGLLLWPGWPFGYDKANIFTTAPSTFDHRALILDVVVAAIIVASTAWTLENWLRHWRGVRFGLSGSLCWVGVVAVLLALWRYDAAVIGTDYEWTDGPFHSGAWTPKDYDRLLYNPLSGDPSAATYVWPSAPWYIQAPIYCGVGCSVHALGVLLAGAFRMAAEAVNGARRNLG